MAERRAFWCPKCLRRVFLLPGEKVIPRCEHGRLVRQENRKYKGKRA